jgi:uncharacterized protein YhaN
MRLRRLDLARYGKFTDQMIDFGERVDGEPDLHIVYGPNEVGKSTAFAGFLDLLFGIELQSRYGFLHPYATMRVGGCLELSVGVRELVRIKRPLPTLRDAANEPVPEGLIFGDLGGLDRNAYRTMFSLDDDTLEAGGKSILANNSELGQLLFSASAGLSDLRSTLLDLRLETDGFTKPNARGGELQQLKAALVSLKQERDAIDTLAYEYSRLAAATDGAASQYVAALAERAQAKAGLVRARRLLAALPRMAALRQLRERLEPLASLPEAPPEWLGELPGLQQGENRHRSETELAEAEVKHVSDELEAVVVDECALRLVGRLDRPTELRARHVTAELDLPSRRRELACADGEVGSILMRLGCEDEQEPARLLLNAAQSAALSSLIVTRSGVDAKVTAAGDELLHALHELTEGRRALQQASGSASAPSVAPVILALAALRESDHAIRLRSAAKARTQHGESLATRLTALAPWNGSVEELAQLIVPEVASVEAWHTATQRDDALIDQRREEVDRLETELERRAAELDAIAKTAACSATRRRLTYAARARPPGRSTAACSTRPPPMRSRRPSSATTSSAARASVTSGTWPSSTRRQDPWRSSGPRPGAPAGCWTNSWHGVSARSKWSPAPRPRSARCCPRFRHPLGSWAGSRVATRRSKAGTCSGKPSAKCSTPRLMLRFYTTACWPRSVRQR